MLSICYQQMDIIGSPGSTKLSKSGDKMKLHLGLWGYTNIRFG